MTNRTRAQRVLADSKSTVRLQTRCCHSYWNDLRCSMVHLCLGAACLYGFLTILHSLPSSTAIVRRGGYDDHQEEDVIASSTYLKEKLSNESSSQSRLLPNQTNHSDQGPAPPRSSKSSRRGNGWKKRRWRRTRDAICFITSIVEDDANEVPMKLPTVDQVTPIHAFRRWINDHKNTTNTTASKTPFEYFLFTDVTPKFRRGWTIMEQPDVETLLARVQSTNSSGGSGSSDSRQRRRQSLSLETVERWIQFVPWRHERISQQCRVVFFFSYLESWKPRASTHIFKWAQSLMQSPQGLTLQRDVRFPTLQDLQRHLELGTKRNELDELDQTIKWIEADSRRTHSSLSKNKKKRKDDWRSAPVYHTTVMGLDLNNSQARAVTEEFWNLYESEQYTVYDALLFSYLVYKYELYPLPSFPLPLDRLLDLNQQGRVTATERNSLGRLVVSTTAPETTTNSARTTQTRKQTMRSNQKGANRRQGSGQQPQQQQRQRTGRHKKTTAR